MAWHCLRLEGATVATFALSAPDGLLRHEQLAHIVLPAELQGREHEGLILSGRGPIWLYAHLVHLAHSFAWVAVHDPRLSGGVVVMRHTPEAPRVGEIVGLEPPPVSANSQGRPDP